MNFLKSAVLAIALAAMPLSAAVPALAQVSSIDVHMAQSAIMSAGTRAAQVARIVSVPSLGVVHLDSRTVPRLSDDSIPDVSEFRIMVQKNHDGIRKLRTALAGNPATRHALEERGISVSRVVGAQISSNGSLRLYLL